MTDAVALAKLALAQVGGQRLVSLSEDSPEATAINDSLWAVRRDEIAANIWGFARKRAELSAETTAPAFGFTKQYVIPADSLRILAVRRAGSNWYYPGLVVEAEPSLPFAIEGRRILTNLDAPLQIEYLFDEDTVANWSASFTMMVGVRLAEIIAYDLSDTAALTDRLTRRYEQALQRAVLTNECQTLPARPPDSEWLVARGGQRYVPLASVAT